MIVRVLLYVLAAVAVLIVIVAAVGYALPQNHTASREAVFPASPGDLFAVIVDVGRYAEWRKEVSSVEVLSSSPLKWRERSGGDTVTYEVAESRPPDLLVVRIADPELPFGGTWTHELQSRDGGTRLVITERGEVYNPIFRFMSRFIFGHTSGLEAFIENLHRKVG